MSEIKKKLDRSLFEEMPHPPELLLNVAPFDLNGGNFRGVLFERVSFGSSGTERVTLSNVDFCGAEFIDCRFDNCELNGCSLKNAKFIKTNLRGARLIDCDFRYSFFDEATLAETIIKYCDFYRAIFCSNNVFERSSLHHCSLHRAAFDGSDLNWSEIGQTGIVQANAAGYKVFLEKVAERDKEKPISAEKIKQYVDVGHLEAAAICRKFSTLFAARGQFNDSSEAYVRARQLERFGFRPSVHRKSLIAEAGLRGLPPPTPVRLNLANLRGLTRYIDLCAADLICRFGTSVSRVLMTMLVVIFGFATFYWLSGGITTPYGLANFSDCFVFSIGKTFADVPDGFKINDLARPFAALQVFISVALIGLFGFVLGNYFRQS